MFALLFAAVTVSAGPAVVPHGAVFQPSAVTASALVTVRILEGVTIEYRGAKPVGAIARRETSLLVDGQNVAATLIEFP